MTMLALAGALLMTACGSGEPQPQAGKIFVPEPQAATTYDQTKLTEGITISQGTWADYQSYLTKMGRIGGGWYAVTEDGQGGGGWSCAAALCEQSFDGRSAALKACQDANPGKTCILFAKNDIIQMKYDVAQ